MPPLCLSDRFLKKDIRFLELSPSGIPVYSFRYRWDKVQSLSGELQPVSSNAVYVGAIAQDLLELAPDAVVWNPADGLYRVDYSKIDVDFRKV